MLADYRGSMEFSDRISRGFRVFYVGENAAAFTGVAVERGFAGP